MCLFFWFILEDSSYKINIYQFAPVMSSVVETSLKRFLHSLRSVEMTICIRSVEMTIRVGSVEMTICVRSVEISLPLEPQRKK